MELLIEIIFELIFEGGEAICSNSKISKWIRYPILFVFTIFFTVITFGIIALGVIVFKQNIAVSLFCIAVGLIFLIGFIYKFKKVYIKKKGEK